MVRMSKRPDHSLTLGINRTRTTQEGEVTSIKEVVDKDTRTRTKEKSPALDVDKRATSKEDVG